MMRPFVLDVRHALIGRRVSAETFWPTLIMRGYSPVRHSGSDFQTYKQHAGLAFDRTTKQEEWSM